MATQHKPYPPTMAGLGLSPTTSLDVPITSVFLVLFLIGAITHMTILQVNLRRGQKFIMSGMMFGFCMARITACTMRIVWSRHLTDVSVAIAAQIFVAAGVIILFVVNIIFTQRVLRASHPRLGWHKVISWAFRLYIASIIAVIIALITAVVQSFYTRDRQILIRDRDIQRFGGTYFAVAAFLPIPLIAVHFLLPRRTEIENFGAGRFNSKIALLLITSSLLTLGAAFRAGISYVPRPIANPAWYHSKACFYLFDFTIEITVVALYAIMRVDKRFIIPNGARGAGSYSGAAKNERTGTESDENHETPGGFGRVISSEEEFFDDAGEASRFSEERKIDDLESGVNSPTAEQHKVEA